MAEIAVKIIKLNAANEKGKRTLELRQWVPEEKGDHDCVYQFQDLTGFSRFLVWFDTLPADVRDGTKELLLDPDKFGLKRTVIKGVIRNDSSDDYFIVRKHVFREEVDHEKRHRRSLASVVSPEHHPSETGEAMLMQCGPAGGISDSQPAPQAINVHVHVDDPKLVGGAVAGGLTVGGLAKKAAEKAVEKVAEKLADKAAGKLTDTSAKILQQVMTGEDPKPKSRLSDRRSKKPTSEE